jgi:hypothetical protein
MGSLLQGMGAASLGDLVPWLLATLRSEASAVERQGGRRWAALGGPPAPARRAAATALHRRRAHCTRTATTFWLHAHARTPTLPRPAPLVQVPRKAWRRCWRSWARPTWRR